MRKRNRNNKILLVVALILCITVGYAALTTTLNITGNSKIKNAKWDIHFDSLKVDGTSVSASTPAAIDSNKTTVNYAVNLVKPGDVYSFTVDVVNEGTIDGMISVISNPGLSDAQKKYVDYSVKYDGGKDLKAKDGIKAGAKRKIKVIVKYRDDINPEDLPENTETLTLTLTVEYVQADGTAVFPPPPVMKAYTGSSSSDYHNSSYSGRVTKVVTKTNIDIPATAIKHWDVSEAGDGSVIAYIEDDGSGNGTYKVTIGGDGGKVVANENSDYLFYYFGSLKEVDLSNFDTSQTTSMVFMFMECMNLESVNVSDLDTRNVTSIAGMFRRCVSLTNLDLSSFDTRNVTNMSSLFEDCSSLTNVDLSNFDTSKVENMYNMFSFCGSLTSVDISHFDTSKVTDMRYMFYGCSKLTTSITIKNKNTSSYSSMFSGAAKESGAQITVNYISATSSLVDSMIATKSSDSNVVKGTLVS